MIGDSNINLLERSQAKLHYSAILTSYNFALCNKELPTRISQTTATLLDHFFINTDNVSYNLFNIINDLSDHNLLILELYSQENDSSRQTGPEVKIQIKLDFTKLNHFFLESVKPTLPNEVNGAYNSINSYVWQGLKTSGTECKKYIPKTGRLINPWITQEFLYLNSKKVNSMLKLKLYSHPLRS